MTNNRFEDLEKRAKKIQLKQKLQSLFFVIIGIVAFCLISFFVTTSKKEITKPQVPTVVKNVQVQTPNEDKIRVQQESNISKESYNTVQLSLSLNPVENEKKQALEETKKEQNVTTEIVPKVEVNTTQKPTFSLHVKQTSSEEILLKDFEMEKTYVHAVTLSKFYFDESDYQKAIYWAKESSRLKPESAIPWLLYAKSKSALGQNIDAMKALENYLSYFPSKEVQELLIELKQGAK